MVGGTVIGLTPGWYPSSLSFEGGVVRDEVNDSVSKFEVARRTRVVLLTIL